MPAFIGIGSEDKQVPATSPAYHQGVINPTVTQTDGAVPQFVLGLPGTTDRVATLSNPSLPSKSSMALSPHVKGGDTDSPRGRGTALSVVGICPVEDEQFEVTDARLCVSALCEGVRIGRVEGWEDEQCEVVDAGLLCVNAVCMYTCTCDHVRA